MLVITLGDPYSVSIELLAPILAAGIGSRHPVTLIGSRWHWDDQARRLGLPPLAAGVTFRDVVARNDAGRLERPAETLSSRERGELSRAALESLRDLPPGARLAVVTAPIDKHAAHEAGFAYPGHTEFFEALWQGSAVMTLAGRKLKVGLVTNHLPLCDVPKALSKALIETKLLLFADTLRRSFGIKRPRVAACGVNPHAGDKGLFGKEDQELVHPAVQSVKARDEHADYHGPVAADTVFYRATQGQYDGVLAMYHDQGLGPLKTVHFDDAVNLSGGLKHFRASPDHGPARDLFLRRQASPKSFAAAIDLACKYLEKG